MTTLPPVVLYNYTLIPLYDLRGKTYDTSIHSQIVDMIYGRERERDDSLDYHIIILSYYHIILLSYVFIFGDQP